MKTSKQKDSVTLVVLVNSSGLPQASTNLWGWNHSKIIQAKLWDKGSQTRSSIDSLIPKIEQTRGDELVGDLQLAPLSILASRLPKPF